MLVSDGSTWLRFSVTVAPPVIWDHTVLPATQNKRTPPARRPVLHLFTPEGWKAELTLVLPIYDLPICRPAVAHPSSDSDLTRSRTPDPSVACPTSCRYATAISSPFRTQRSSRISSTKRTFRNSPGRCKALIPRHGYGYTLRRPSVVKRSSFIAAAL